MNGPVASAGSIFILSRSNGTSVPKMLANMTTTNRLKETEAVIARSPSMKKLYTNTTRLMMLALIIETTLSFITCVKMFPSFNVLFAKPCTTIAED